MFMKRELFKVPAKKGGGIMLTVKLTVSQKLERQQKEDLAVKVSGLTADELAGALPEIQVIINDDTVVSSAGNFLAPSAFAAVISGESLSQKSCIRLSAAYCGLLAGYGISSQRIHICFNGKMRTE